MSAWSPSSAQHDPHSVFENPEAYANLSAIVEKIQERDFEAISDLLHPDFTENESTAGQLAELLDSLPAGELEFELFYAENRVGVGEYAGVPIYFAVYESKTNTGFVQMNLAVAPEDGVCCLGTYINFISSTTRPSEYNDLTLSGKGWKHYLVAFTAAGVLVLTLFTGIKCAFASDTARKWLWVPFVLVGLWGITFNWTTGQLNPSFVTITGSSFHISFIQFKLFGVGVQAAGPFHPWIVEIGAPIGAVLYWLAPGLRKRRDRTPAIESLD